MEPSLQAGQPATAVDAARQMQALGRGLGRTELVLIGLNCEGRALIKSGQLIDGLALLDEAMVTVLDGGLSPFVTGTLYCHTIAACHEVADVRRMARWTELAERKALQVAADLDAQRVDYAAEAWYVVAEARRQRGHTDWSRGSTTSSRRCAAAATVHPDAG